MLSCFMDIDSFLVSDWCSLVFQLDKFFELPLCLLLVRRNWLVFKSKLVSELFELFS